MTRCAAVAALVISLCLPAAAAAAPITVTRENPPDQLTLTATSAAETVTLTGFSGAPGARTFEFTSAATFNNPAPAGCSLSSGDTIITCTDVDQSVAYVFLGEGTDTFSVDPTNAELTVAVFGGQGHDDITGGQGDDFLFGGGGDDVVEGRDGDDEIDGYVGSGNPADGADAADILIGSEGADTMQDTGNTPGDRVNLNAEARSDGVTATLDGLANDGHPTFDGPSSISPIKGADNIDSGIEWINGTAMGDDLTGNAENNILYGNGGDDTLTGLDGHDDLLGGSQADTLNARDSDDDTEDFSVNCGTGIGATDSPGDVANVDRADPAPVACATVNRFSPSTNTNTNTNTGGGGGATTSTTPAATPAPVPPPRKLGDVVLRREINLGQPARFTFPDYLRGTNRCGKKGWCRSADIKRDLTKYRVNFALEEREATKKTLERVVGKSVQIGEVLRTDPEEGDAVTSSPQAPFRLRLTTFEPADIEGCNLERPFIRLNGVIHRLTDYLKDMNPVKAERILREAGCPRSKIEIDERLNRKALDPTVRRANVAGSGSKRRLVLVVDTPPDEITFEYPKPRLASGFLPAFVVVSGGALETVLPVGHNFVLAVRPTKNQIGLTDASVTLRTSEGEYERFSRTARTGVADLAGNLDEPGRYAISTRVCDREGDCVSGAKRIDAIRLDTGRTYLGVDGLEYRYSSGRWSPIARAAGTATARASAVVDERTRVGTLVGRTIQDVLRSPMFRFSLNQRPTGPAARAFTTIESAVDAAFAARGGPAELLDELLKRGVGLQVLAGAGRDATTLTETSFARATGVASDGRRVTNVQLTAVNIHDGALGLQVGEMVVLPGGVFYELGGGGRVAGTGAPSPLDVGSGRLDVADIGGTTALGLAGAGGSPLIGTDGGSLIGLDGASLIGLDGGSLIGLDGGSLIGLDGGSLIGLDGGSLIGLDGGSLIGLDGGSLIGLDGGSLVPR